MTASMRCRAAPGRQTNAARWPSSAPSPTKAGGRNGTAGIATAGTGRSVAGGDRGAVEQVVESYPQILGADVLGAGGKAGEGEREAAGRDAVVERAVVGEAV